jgi:hypothetical protein
MCESKTLKEQLVKNVLEIIKYYEMGLIWSY